MSAGIPVIQKHEKQRLCQAPPIKWQLDSAKISHTYFSLGKLQKPQLSGFKESYKKKRSINSTDKEPWETSKTAIRTEIYEQHGHLTHPHFRFLKFSAGIKYTMKSKVFEQ